MKTKRSKRPPSSAASASESGEGREGREGNNSKKGLVSLSLKIGGYDMRKEIFKGYVEIEEFEYRDLEGSFVVLRRDQVGFLSFSPSPCPYG